MLTVTSAQREMFAAAAKNQLADQVAAYIARHFPVPTRFSGEGAMRDAAAAAIERALGMGCETQREAGLYVLLNGLLGHDFATDPRQPWAAGWLQPLPGTNIRMRLDRLLDLANEQIDTVHGPDNKLLIRSLLRVRRLKPDDFAAAGADPSSCATWLAWVLPGWAQEQDGAALRAVADAAPNAAAKLGLEGPGAIAVIALHHALLGQGFATDPLYPWAGDALAGRDPDRAARLFGISLSYIEEVLK